MRPKALFLWLALVALSALALPSLQLCVSQSDNIRIDKLLVCERVSGPGAYVERADGTFNAGEVLYVYIEVWARGHGASAMYSYDFSLTLTIVNPFGLTFKQFNEVYRDQITSPALRWAWWVSLNLSYDFCAFTGPYMVVAEVVDGATGERATSTTFFRVLNGLSPTVRYNITESVKVINQDRYDKCRVVSLYLAVVPSLRPYQSVVEGPLFDLAPRDFVVDGHGNTYAVFKDLEVPAGEEVTITAKYVVDVRCVKYLDHNEGQGISAEARRYLGPSRYVESDHPLIVATAGSLTHGLNSTIDKVFAALKFVVDHLEYDPSTPPSVGAVEAYESHKGVCEQYARLFTALCRAMGVPARVVKGFGLLSLKPNVVHRVDALHAWAQFFAQNYSWIPLETQSYELFGLTPLRHIILTWGEDPTNVDGFELSPVPLSLQYAGGSPRIETSLTYIVEFLNESFELSRAETSMTLYAPSACSLGSSIKIEGHLEPALANVPVGILVESPLGGQMPYTALTDALGRFEVSFVVNESGTWIIRASWGGNAFYRGSQASAKVAITDKSTEGSSTTQTPEGQAGSVMVLDLSLVVAVFALICIGAIVVLVLRRAWSVTKRGLSLYHWRIDVVIVE